MRNLTRSGDFQNIDLQLRAGEILGITGLLGSGRSEIAEAVFGIRPAQTGEVIVAGRAHKIGSIRDAVKAAFYGEGFLPSPDTRKCHEVYTGERSSGIRINLAGRDPHGLVQPGDDYEAFCDWLIEEIGAVRNDGTGETLASEIVRTRDVFTGPMADTLPDLLVTWNRHAPIRSVSSPSIGRIRHPHPSIRTGDHSPDGLFLLAGPGFAARRLNDDVSVIDLAPSLAALFGVEPAAFQGRALKQLAPTLP